MKKLLEKFDGYKMYIGLGIGAAAILFNHFVTPIAGVDLDSNNWLEDLYGLAVLASGRSALKKVER